MPRRSLKRRVTYQIVFYTIKDSFTCWHEQLGIVEHSLRQFRPQSLSYPVSRGTGNGRSGPEDANC